jgi:hypothetical protein
MQRNADQGYLLSSSFHLYTIIPAQGVASFKGPVDFHHSPACFYYTGKQGIDEVTNYMELEDRN